MSDFWARMPPFGDSNSSRRSDCSVVSARNACSWVMFVFHSSRCPSSGRSSVVLSVVRFPLPVLRLPNCRGTLPPTAFHHGRPVCLLPPPKLLTVSQLSSSQLQLTLPTTVWGVSLVPPLRFPLLGPPVGFPSSPSRLLSPPWPSPDFSRLPRSLLFTSCTSFPSPFFVSHTITLTPSSHDLPQFHH